MNATLSQAIGIVTLAYVAVAPLPIVLYLQARERAQRLGTVRLGHSALVGVVVWVMIECQLVSALGWLGLLWLQNVLFLASAVLACGLWLIARDGEGAVSQYCHDLGRAIAALRQEPLLNLWLVAVLGSIGLTVLAQLLVLPVTDFDSLNYQLPRMVQWYQTGSFYVAMPQYGDLPINSYPFAWNGLFFLAAAAVGHDQFILLVNLLSWVMLGLAVANLGRLCGGARMACLFAATLVMLLPLSVGNVRTAHIDLAFGAFFLASTYFTLDAWQESQVFPALMAAACGGMVLGTKMSGVPYVGLLLGLWACLFVLGRWRGGARTRWLRGIGQNHVMAVLALGSITVVGVSWYLHNAAVMGNPLGIVRVSLLGRTVWDGSITMALAQKTSLWNSIRLGEASHWVTIHAAMAEWLGVPGLVVGLLAIGSPFWARERGPRRALLATLAGLGVVTLYLYLSTPWTANEGIEEGVTAFMGQALRYGFPFFGILGAVAGATLPSIRPGVATWAAGAIVLTSAVFSADPWQGQANPGKWRALVVGVTLLLFLTSTTLWRPLEATLTRLLIWQRQHGKIAVGVTGTAGLALLLLASSATATALRFRHRVQGSLLGGISRFVEEELPSQTRIGFWASYSTYLLYGRDLRRPLTYIQLDGAQTREEMLARLRAQPVDVIAIGPRFRTLESPQIWQWLDEELPRVHGGDVSTEVLLYAIKQSMR